jgi:methyl-accepting chemotaxis protein
MDTTDVTIEILREIRDAVRETNGRIDQTNGRIDETNARLDETNARLEEQTDRLDRRITESEIRTATAINGLKGAIDDVKQLLADRLDLRDRVDRVERDIEVMKARLAGVVGFPSG